MAKIHIQQNLIIELKLPCVSAEVDCFVISCELIAEDGD